MGASVTNLPDTTNRRILVIDDSLAIHADFRKILGEQSESQDLAQMESVLFDEETSKPHFIGFDLDFADQGQAGFALVQTALQAGRPYAVAFVDMRMPPGWDGLETIEHLWEVDPAIQIVICTAYSDHDWEQITHRLGHSDQLLILRKPFDTIRGSATGHGVNPEMGMRAAELPPHCEFNGYRGPADRRATDGQPEFARGYRPPPGG